MNIIHDISNFIFINNSTTQHCDIIFIPGSNFDKLAYTAASLYKDGLSSKILPSGKYSINHNHFENPSSETCYSTEFEFLKDILIKNGVKECDILKEDTAQNTYENSLKSRKITDKNNLKITNAIIVCKSFHARRCLMYYQLAYPNTKFYIYPVDYQNITRENWYKSTYGINTVLGELERCGWQFKKILSDSIK